MNFQEFILPDTAEQLVAEGAPDCDGVMGKFDWVVDAIDSVAPKQLLIAAAHHAGARVISSMGAGEGGRSAPGAREEGS